MNKNKHGHGGARREFLNAKALRRLEYRGNLNTDLPAGIQGRQGHEGTEKKRMNGIFGLIR